MFDIGFMELMVVAIVGMVVIGPERLPEAARSVGKTVGKVKRFFNAMQKQIEQELRLDEINKQIMEETKDLKVTLNTDPVEPKTTPSKPEVKAENDTKTAE